MRLLLTRLYYRLPIPRRCFYCRKWFMRHKCTRWGGNIFCSNLCADADENRDPELMELLYSVLHQKK